MHVSKKRIDVLLVDRGLVESRARAQRLVMAGQVEVNGQLVHKPSTVVPGDADVHLDPGPAFVSRGGEKLAAGLEHFNIRLNGWVCADVGASTGGFTDCLLQKGASRVYAIDVGTGLLAWRLRQDPRIVVLENTNARYLDRLPEPVQLVTMDVSFISVKLLIPVIRGWFASEGGQSVLLIKPQFEAGRMEVSRGKGVIRDPAIHRYVLHDILQVVCAHDYGVRGLFVSPLLGPKGNKEFFVHLTYPGKTDLDLESAIEGIVTQG